ncbi:unnamed protein product [Peronospora farinosa]|nr:unnamed protein product [Peronospora farinosa]
MNQTADIIAYSKNYRPKRYINELVDQTQRSNELRDEETASCRRRSSRIMNVAVEVVTPCTCKNESKAVGVRYATVFMRSNSSLRTTHPEIMCTVDIVSGHLTSFLLNDCAQMLLPKLTVGSLFMTQEHALILAHGDKILG